MENNQSSRPPAPDPIERESIWSVPARWGRWYGGIFSVQYLLFLLLTTWDEVVYRNQDNLLQTVLAVQRGMTGSILNMAASAYVILEGFMLAEWLKARDRRKEREAVEKGREEALKEGREAGLQEGLEAGMRTGQRRLQRRWEAWHQRQQAALRDGRPFTEPPPAGPDSPGPTNGSTGSP